MPIEKQIKTKTFTIPTSPTEILRGFGDYGYVAKIVEMHIRNPSTTSKAEVYLYDTTPDGTTDILVKKIVVDEDSYVILNEEDLKAKFNYAIKISCNISGVEASMVIEVE